MKTKIQLGLRYYGIGLLVSTLCIGFIHANSYLFDTYFAYATWDVILFTAFVSAVPFGFGLYILHEKVNAIALLKVWCSKKSF